MVDISWQVGVAGLTLVIFTLACMVVQPVRQKSYLLLAVWLVLLTFPLLQTMAVSSQVSLQRLSFIFNPTFSLLHGPLLYGYVLFLVKQNFKLEYRHLVHLLPFALCYALFMLSLSHLSIQPGGMQSGSQASVAQDSSILHLVVTNFGLLNTVIFVVYSLLTIQLLIGHQRKLTRYFSQINYRITLKWVFLLPVAFGFFSVLNFVNELGPGDYQYMHPQTLHLLSYFTFIILLCFFGINQKIIFSVDEDIAQVNALPKEPAARKSESEAEPTADAAKAETYQNDDAWVADVLKQIKACMEQEQPYLEQSFTVYQLADMTGVPRRMVSFALSQGLNKNFYQFVNEYRLEQVKVQLQSAENQRFTILDVAYNCGFKSKSSFNSLFKQYFGVTPSQFRKAA